MKTLCIYCCGGMGREIADLSDRLKKWDRIIFVDDSVTNRIINEIEVYTLEEVLEKYDKDEIEFIVTAGEPTSRKFIYERLNKGMLNCISIFSPGFELSKFSSVDKGTIIHLGVLATCNVRIGYGCLINKHVVIGHDVTIGDYCVLSPNVTIGGNVKVGDNSFIGSGAIIRNGIIIGENSIIGMGAVVLKDVAPNSIMVGNPAKFLRKNDDKRVFKRH